MTQTEPGKGNPPSALQTIRAQPPFVIAMVGLPARGKTFIARRLSRYLSWRGYATRVFNVGSYRREHLGAFQPNEFFDPENIEASAARHRMAELAFDDLAAWLLGDGEVAIFDATNTTRERREYLRRRCEENGFVLLFVESICDDNTIIDLNVRETKLRSPDYVGVAPTAATRDFRARIAHYARGYEQVTEDEGAFIKLIDVGKQMMTNAIEGQLPGRLVFFLLNLHVQSRSFWITRHGESEFNAQGRVGGDPSLTGRGEAYAHALAEFVDTHISPRKAKTKQEELLIWTSTLRRTIETARALKRPFTELRELDEIDAGNCDGLTYAEIEARMPWEFQARSANKYSYRYPRGESYEDVIRRLEPIILELERVRAPILIIAHQAVSRALYAYFMDRPPSECPHIDIPLHTVIQLTPTAYGCDERRIELEGGVDR